MIWEILLFVWFYDFRDLNMSQEGLSYHNNIPTRSVLVSSYYHEIPTLSFLVLSMTIYQANTPRPNLQVPKWKLVVQGVVDMCCKLIAYFGILLACSWLVEPLGQGVPSETRALHNFRSARRAERCWAHRAHINTARTYLVQFWNKALKGYHKKIIGKS